MWVNQHIKPIKIMEQEKEKVYKLGKKEYVLQKEVVKGGCQGCAFYDKLDCSTAKMDGTLTRSSICNTEHKIFKRLFNHK